MHRLRRGGRGYCGFPFAPGKSIPWLSGYFASSSGGCSGEKKSVLSCFVARVVYGIEREWRGFGTLRGLASNGELNGVQV